jgi:hypothetical protein
LRDARVRLKPESGSTLDIMLHGDLP